MDSYSRMQYITTTVMNKKINVDKPVTLFSMRVAYTGIWPVDYAVVTQVGIACAGHVGSAHVCVFKVMLGSIPVHTEYRCFFLLYEFRIYRNTVVCRLNNIWNAAWRDSVWEGCTVVNEQMYVLLSIRAEWFWKI